MLHKIKEMYRLDDMVVVPIQCDDATPTVETWNFASNRIMQAINNGLLSTQRIKLDYTNYQSTISIMTPTGYYCVLDSGASIDEFEYWMRLPETQQCLAMIDFIMSPGGTNRLNILTDIRLDPHKKMHITELGAGTVAVTAMDSTTTEEQLVHISNTIQSYLYKDKLTY